MRRIDVIKANKKHFEEHVSRIRSMGDFEKQVAENVVLPWLKGNNWMGGMKDSEFEKSSKRVPGHTEAEVYEEFWRQVKTYEF